MREADSHGGTGLVQSVERAVEVLQVFSVAEPRLTLGEITSRVGTSRATAHRYVTTLRKAKLLLFHETSGTYTLAPQMLTFATIASAGMPIIRRAEPFMDELVKRVDETVVLSILDGRDPVVVRVNTNTQRAVKVSVQVGMRLNRFWSAQAQVFHAFSPTVLTGPAELVPDDFRRFSTAIQLVKEEGVAVHTNTEWGVRSIAVPLFMGSQIIAALAVIGTIATVRDDLVPTLVTRLKETAASITQDDNGGPQSS